MNEKLQRRLDALKAEYETGQKMLAELDAKRQTLTSTLLRIDGAIQVLREMTEEPKGQGEGEGSAPKLPPAS